MRSRDVVEGNLLEFSEFGHDAAQPVVAGAREVDLGVGTELFDSRHVVLGTVAAPMRVLALTVDQEYSQLMWPAVKPLGLGALLVRRSTGPEAR